MALPRPKVRRSVSHWGAFTGVFEGERLVGVEPFEHDPHPTELIKVWPEMLDSALRVAAPMVRRGYLDGDGGRARGEDSFVAVSWERALDLVAGELDRVRKTHGNASIFGGSYGWSSAGRIHHARTLVHRFLNSIGGFTGQINNYSYGAAMAILPHLLGSAEAVNGPLTSWSTVVEHCEVLLAIGGVPGKNWEVQSGGFGTHPYPERMAALAGSRVRVVNISPYRDDMPAAIGAEWLAPRPNTDAALLLAMVREIVAAGRHDRAFLARYCHGFDKLDAYLAGEADGIVKDAAWAAAITGLPAAAIRDLALSLPGKRVMVSATWSIQRAHHGEQPYWAAIALASVLGQIGLPGGGVGFGYGSSNGMGNPPYGTPMSGLPIGNNDVGLLIPVARVADLLLQPGDTVRYNGRTLTYPDIRLVYWAGGNPFHHHQDLNRLREAFRRPDTVVVHEPYWTATARHADIVLPATTTLERDDIGGSSRDRYLLAMHRMVAPVGAARNDYDIFADLAARLGAGESFTGGRTSDDWIRIVWGRTREALAVRGIAAPDFETFWETGYFAMPEPERPLVYLEGFRADPEGAPLRTASGRIELFSDKVAAMGEPGQPGHPVWKEPAEWLGNAGRYPLHLLTPQPAKRLHGQMDASRVSFAEKAGGRERLVVNPADAEARGIRTGDIVRLFNERGACLAVAEVTDAVRPGVLLLPTGATFDPDGRLDRNSNPNVLTLDIGTSDITQGCAAQTCLVEIERVEGAAPEIRTYRPPAIAAE